MRRRDTVITVSVGKFSMKGFWYYWKRKKMFTKRSYAILLTTIEEGMGTKSISVATSLALCKHVWVKRDGTTLNAKPETELEEGDEVIFWMAMGNIHYKVQNNKLILTKC